MSVEPLGAADLWRELPREPEASACRFAESLVSGALGISAHELHATSRGRAPIAHARQTAMYLAHVTLGVSMTSIGRWFDRHRTTVAHACAVIENGRDSDSLSPVDCLEAALGCWREAFLAVQGGAA